MAVVQYLLKKQTCMFSYHFKRMRDLEHLISLLHTCSTHNVYLFHAKLVSKLSLQNEAIVSQHEVVSYIAAPISQYNYLVIVN